jgi:hypothetical protein
VREHADAETLAAFREELLSRRKAARVSAHLATCPRCAALDAQLTEVSALLTTSVTPPMPDGLTARIEAAIAAEAAARAVTAADGTLGAAHGARAAADGALAAADGTRAVGAAGAGTGPRDRAARPSRPARGPGRSRLALRVAAVTAAVVVVAGGGYGVAKLLTENPQQGTSAGSAAAPAPRPNSKVPSNGALRVPGGEAATGSSSPHPPVVRSGTNYQPGQLEAQVSAVLAQYGAHAATNQGRSPASQPASSLKQVPACVPHVTGGKRPVLVDLAKYRGRPATVIVTPGTIPGTLRAQVVAGGCTATTGRVLAATTFPGSG